MIEITEREAELLKEKGIRVTDRAGNIHILVNGFDLIVNPDFTDIANKDG